MNLTATHRKIFDEWIYILDALRKYEYGAVIEVTCGSYHGRKKEHKAEVMKYIRKKTSSFTTPIKVDYGLATLNGSSERLKSLRPSFRVHIKYPNQVLYRKSAIKIMNTPWITSVEKSFLEQKLEESESGGTPLNQLLLIEKNKGLDECSEINGIRGAISEQYISFLFEHALMNKWKRIYNRQRVPNKEGSRDIDLLVICSRSDFRDALEYIEKEQRKVSITYKYKY